MKNSAKEKLHFSRYEFKYILRQDVRDSLEKELQYFLELDPFVARSTNQKYFVRSLYFDDPAYTAFYEKVDGLHSRYKFRLRTYTKSFEQLAPCFLEIKGRTNNLVVKRRVRAGNSDEYMASGSDVTKIILDRAEDSPVSEKFHYHIARRRIRLVALIDYERRPYVSKYDPNFRLTFDEQLVATKTPNLFPVSSNRSRRLVAGYTVMEVKFSHHIPSWFHRVIQGYNLRRVSISKICTGLDVLGVVDDI